MNEDTPRTETIVDMTKAEEKGKTVIDLLGFIESTHRSLELVAGTTGLTWDATKHEITKG